MCDRDQPQAFSVETMFDTNFTEVDMEEFRRQTTEPICNTEDDLIQCLPPLVFHKWDQYGRHCSIYGDVMLWTLENPTPSNVIIVAKIIDYDFGFAFRCLSDSWSYGVLLSQEPNPIWRFPVGSAPTFLASIFDRSSPRLPTLAISLPNVSGSG
ncbi:hypothetical protein CARUB_v10006260mg [Capsella rubella]|uniref:Uncharacterized protein n=1 Tax=Capsella rubella TaxID=81985 RepID=R0GZV1_9BRAS|nr:hypothetical protein CARUB_v10006260mg [Capsella rubella]